MKKIPVDYLAHCETDKKLKAHLSLKSERELLDFLGCDFFYLPGRDISQNEGAVPFYKHKLDFTETERTCPLEIRWKRGANDSKFSVDSAIRGPLDNPDLKVEDILRFPWPRAADFDFSPLLDEAEMNRSRTSGPLDLLVNRGTIEHLSLNQVSLEASDGPARGMLVRNCGKIQNQSFLQVSAKNAAVEMVDAPKEPK